MSLLGQVQGITFFGLTLFVNSLFINFMHAEAKLLHNDICAEARKVSQVFPSIFFCRVLMKCHSCTIIDFISYFQGKLWMIMFEVCTFHRGLWFEIYHILGLPDWFVTHSCSIFIKDRGHISYDACEFNLFLSGPWKWNCVFDRMNFVLVKVNWCFFFVLTLCCVYLQDRRVQYHLLPPSHTHPSMCPSHILHCSSPSLFTVCVNQNQMLVVNQVDCWLPRLEDSNCLASSSVYLFFSLPLRLSRCPAVSVSVSVCFSFLFLSFLFLSPPPPSLSLCLSVCLPPSSPSPESGCLWLEFLNMS